jgi:hypothetical protein
MEEHLHDADQSLRERARWLHDVRNAVNTAGVAVALSKRLLSRGDTTAALDMLDVANESWGRCRDLLISNPTAREALGQDAADDLLRPRDASAPEPHAPPPRR